MSAALLKGQTALVTGANSRFGKAVAIALGRAGTAVSVNYVTNRAAADEVVAEIRKEGSDAIALEADVSSEQQVQTMSRRRCPGSAQSISW